MCSTSLTVRQVSGPCSTLSLRCSCLAASHTHLWRLATCASSTAYWLGLSTLTTKVYDSGGADHPSANSKVAQFHRASWASRGGNRGTVYGPGPTLALYRATLPVMAGIIWYLGQDAW